MPRYERLSIPRDSEIADYIVRGRLGELILANTTDLDLPQPRQLEVLDPPLGEYEEAVVIGAINSLTWSEVGTQFPKGLASPSKVGRTLKDVSERMGVRNRAQLSRHLFCLGIAFPDEDALNVTPELTPTVKLVLGLVSHGMTNEEIVVAAAPWLSDGAVKRSLMSAGDELMQVRGRLGERRDAALTTTLAFEQEVFSTRPDLAMSPDFLVTGMQRLLDPEHQLILPQTS